MPQVRTTDDEQFLFALKSELTEDEQFKLELREPGGPRNGLTPRAKARGQFG